MPRLLRLMAPKDALIPLRPRSTRRSSPRGGRSTLITSAPRSPRRVAQYGPAMTRERSRTRMPSSMLMMRGPSCPLPTRAGRRFLGPRDRERPGRLDLLQDVLGRELGAAREGRVERGHHGLLDFGAAEALRGCGERVQIEALGVAMAAREVDGEDLAPLVEAGQGDEEDLVEAALSHEFWWERGDLVARRDQEDRRLAPLHPAPAPPQDPARE